MTAPIDHTARNERILQLYREAKARGEKTGKTAIAESLKTEFPGLTPGTVAGVLRRHLDSDANMDESTAEPAGESSPAADEGQDQSTRDARIIELARQKLPYQEIADQLGTTRSMVRRVCQRARADGRLDAPERLPLEPSPPLLDEDEIERRAQQGIHSTEDAQQLLHAVTNALLKRNFLKQPGKLPLERLEQIGRLCEAYLRHEATADADTSVGEGSLPCWCCGRQVVFSANGLANHARQRSLPLCIPCQLQHRDRKYEPLPQAVLDRLLRDADAVASLAQMQREEFLNWLDVLCDQVTVEDVRAAAGAVVLTLPKHNGKTIAEVAEADADYLAFLLREKKGKPTLRRQIQDFLEPRKPGPREKPTPAPTINEQLKKPPRPRPRKAESEQPAKPRPSTEDVQRLQRERDALESSLHNQRERAERAEHKAEQLKADNRALRRSAQDMQQGQGVELAIDLIVADPQLQPRESMSEATVEEYQRAVSEGEPLPPGVVFHDGEKYWLADGFHRREARRRAGWTTMLVEVRQGMRRDALLYAAGANGKHGLNRTDADKRRQVLILLHDSEWREWVDREIARHCCVSPTFVGKKRREIEGLPDRSSLSTVDSENGTGASSPERIEETPSAPESPKTRTFRTRHGTTAKMRVDRIGKERTDPETEPATEPPTSDQRQAELPFAEGSMHSTQTPYPDAPPVAETSLDDVEADPPATCEISQEEFEELLRADEAASARPSSRPPASWWLPSRTLPRASALWPAPSAKARAHRRISMPCRLSSRCAMPEAWWWRRSGRSGWACRMARNRGRRSRKRAEEPAASDGVLFPAKWSRKESCGGWRNGAGRGLTNGRFTSGKVYATAWRVCKPRRTQRRKRLAFWRNSRRAKPDSPCRICGHGREVFG